MSTTAKTLFTILFVLVFISIGLNLYLVWELQQTRQEVTSVVQEVGPGVQQSLAQVIADLETFQNTTLEFQVAIDQEFPVAAEIPFNETVEVPINLAVPIRQDIETTIIIDVLGQDLPIDVNVPVDVEIPIDTILSVPIEHTIVISTTVPLKLDVPIAVEIGQSELAGYIDRIRESLISFNEVLDRLMAEVQ